MYVYPLMTAMQFPPKLFHIVCLLLSMFCFIGRRNAFEIMMSRLHFAAVSRSRGELQLLWRIFSTHHLGQYGLSVSVLHNGIAQYICVYECVGCSGAPLAFIEPNKTLT